MKSELECIKNKNKKTRSGVKNTANCNKRRGKQRKETKRNGKARKNGKQSFNASRKEKLVYILKNAKERDVKNATKKSTNVFAFFAFCFTTAGGGKGSARIFVEGVKHEQKKKITEKKGEERKKKRERKSEKKQAMRGKKDKYNLTTTLKGFFSLLFFFLFICFFSSSAASAHELGAGERQQRKGQRSWLGGLRLELLLGLGTELKLGMRVGVGLAVGLGLGSSPVSV